MPRHSGYSFHLDWCSLTGWYKLIHAIWFYNEWWRQGTQFSCFGESSYTVKTYQSAVACFDEIQKAVCKWYWLYYCGSSTLYKTISLFWCVLLPIPRFIELVSILCALRLERGGKSCRGVLTLFGKMPGTKFSNSSRGSACCTLSFFTSFFSQKHFFLNYLLLGSHWQQLLLCACPLSTRSLQTKQCTNVSITPLQQWGFSAMFTFQLDYTKR